MIKKIWISLLVIAVLLIAAAVAVHFYSGAYNSSVKQVITVKPGPKPLGFYTHLELGTTTKSINITACDIKPNIASYVRGSKIKFINNDSMIHRLYFKESKFTIPSRGSLDVNLDFIKPATTKKYDCDSYKAVGMIFAFPIATSTATNMAK